MAQEFFRYETPYGRPRQRTNYFAWTLAILLLTAFAFAAWLGSFYVFWQPERPDSYRLLKKLHRIDPPRRFELTAAPAGEFLNPKQLHDRYGPLGEAELSKANSELARNYIRNFQQVHGLVPYVVGRFRIIDVHQLGSADVFTSGMVALAAAIDNGEVLLEHVYPADRRDIPLMRQTLAPGLEIKFERTHDISAVIHADHSADGRVLITAMPLLYGTYTVTRGTGTFTLEPPLDLNLAAGWPLFKREALRAAEDRYAQLRQSDAASPGSIAIPGITPSGTPPPSENQLVRVEQAIAIETPASTPPPPPSKGAKPTPAGKAGRIAKNQKSTATPSATPIQVAKINSPAPTLSTTPLQKFTESSPTPNPSAPAALRADGAALASTAGGGNWKTYPPGNMPVGRLIAAADLGEDADSKLNVERPYVKGQLEVNFAKDIDAVLSPSSRLRAYVKVHAARN